MELHAQTPRRCVLLLTLLKEARDAHLVLKYWATEPNLMERISVWVLRVDGSCIHTDIYPYYATQLCGELSLFAPDILAILYEQKHLRVTDALVNIFVWLVVAVRAQNDHCN